MINCNDLVEVLKPRIVTVGNKTRLVAQIRNLPEDREIYFETDEQYGEYFDSECSDPFFIPVILYCINKSKSVKFEAPVSYNLLYNWYEVLNGIIHAVMANSIPIEVEAVSGNSTSISTEGKVGTGLSCGLDSFAAVVSHIGEEREKTHRLTHLAIFNTGSHDPFHRGEDSCKSLFNKRVFRAKTCADEIGLPLVVVNSNISDLIPGTYAQFHTFRDITPVLALQKLFSTYLYASGIKVNDTALNYTDSAYYDSISLPLLSTERLRLLSANSTLSSIQKAELVSDFPPAWRHLNVCLYDADNCSICEKCMRRMLALDIIGKLPRFSQVFSLSKFKKNRDWYLGYVITCGQSKSHYKEIVEEMHKRNYISNSEILLRFKWFQKRAYNKFYRTFGWATDRF